MKMHCYYELALIMEDHDVVALLLTMGASIPLILLEILELLHFIEQE
jgi:hypothetical protein